MSDIGNKKWPTDCTKHGMICSSIRLFFHFEHSGIDVGENNVLL